MGTKSEDEFFQDIEDALNQERMKEIEEYSAMAAEQYIKEMQNESQANGPNQQSIEQTHQTYITNTPEAQELQNQQLMQETQLQMQEAILAAMEEYCVRGAMMRCKCGSHYRRINLPYSHGALEAERPLVNAQDCVAGDTQYDNIPYFGVCSSSNNSSNADTILLKKDFQRDIYGKKVSDEVEGNVRGKKCTPVIICDWQNAHETMTVAGVAAITPSSFLICKHGGIIEITDAGQHDEETAI